MSIAENVARIRQEIADAAIAAGRNPKDILLCAATKMNDAAAVQAAIAAGVDLCGENRVQELTQKLSQHAYDGVPVHFIGHLQTNKVKYIIDKVHMIHSLDSERLAAEIDRQAAKCGVVMNVLVEINSGREPNKDGVMPEDAAALCLALGQYSHIKLCGFMTMAPVCEEKAEYRKYFDEISALAVDIWTKTLHNIGSPILSMGMSGSFEQAIASGATAVRVGRRLFEK